MEDGVLLREEDFKDASSYGDGEAAGISRELSANPLFVSGASYDEFQLSRDNVAFAAKQFGLDQAYVDLVSRGPEDARFSVVYHSDAKGLHVDAYRMAGAVGKDSAFTAYVAKDPSFNPGVAYRTELFTELGEGRYFGSVVGGKKLAVPDAADPALKEYLLSHGFHTSGSAAFGELGYGADVGAFFGIKDDYKLDLYEMEKRSFWERFKLFYDLFREDPEYAALKIGDVMGDIGAAMLLGVITPKLWEQGAAYGIAGTITSIGNIGSPALGILGESILGSVVDHAVNSEKPLESLKKVNLATAGLSVVTAAGYFSLHPEILSHFGSNPGTAFIGIYGASTVSSAISGVMSGKANFAIHDQIINKREHDDPTYAENFFQIMGTEASLSRAIYLGTYSATVAAAKAFPGASVALAGAGAALWTASNFVFSLYHEKPDVKATIEGTGYIHAGDRYLFDSGWEVSFKGKKGRLVQEDAGHYGMTFDEGEVYLRYTGDDPVEVSDKRRLKDHLPGFLKPKFLGEKERWSLAAAKGVEISRYANDPYKLKQLSDKEWVLTRAEGEQLDEFWREAQ